MQAVSQNFSKEGIRKRPFARSKTSPLLTKRSTPTAGDVTAAFTDPVGDGDDSSDGVPELEFPTDLPLPEPDSPPGDFTLDPFTGKIPGQEYAKTPSPQPEPLEKDLEESGVAPNSSTTLDTLVKQATEGLTESDLAGSMMENAVVKSEVEPMDTSPPRNDFNTTFWS